MSSVSPRRNTRPVSTARAFSFATNLLRIAGAALVAEHGAARQHTQATELRQAVDETLCDAIAQVLGIGIAADIFERQHGDGLDMINRLGDAARICPGRVGTAAEIPLQPLEVGQYVEGSLVFEPAVPFRALC